MFPLKRLLKRDEVKEQQLYVPASSLIENGSILDRRKQYIDRRASNQKIKPSWDRRVLRDRRRQKKIEGNLVDPETKDYVAILEDAYQCVINALNKLGDTANQENYLELAELLDLFQDEIEIYLRKEEEILHLFIDSVDKRSSKEKAEILSIFYKLIYQSGEEVLHSLEFFAGNITNNNIEDFKKTIAKALDLLASNYQQKQTHLYKIYNKVKDASNN